jgi:TonB family protein
MSISVAGKVGAQHSNPIANPYEDSWRPRPDAHSGGNRRFRRHSNDRQVGKEFANVEGVEIYSLREIAAAAGVPPGHVERHAIASGVASSRGWIAEGDAVRLVREIAAARPAPSDHPTFFAVVTSPPPRPKSGLFASAGIHAAVVVLIVSLALIGASGTESAATPPPAHLVYMMMPGPGGGGGGGGVKVPLPVRRAARKAPEVRKAATPLPEIRPPEPPPTPKVEPTPAPPPPVVQAPVVSTPAAVVEAKGLPAPVEKPQADQGSGTGGGAGTGSGQGVGAGAGSGIGEGTGGGEGGGPFRPGSGIEPPTLLREVIGSYTDDARRRGIQGEVLLEIVIGRDGSVGDVRVVRGLDRGLDQRAIEAVRQWRFSPAKRRGVPVDLLVEVAVEFKLR